MKTRYIIVGLVILLFPISELLGQVASDTGKLSHTMALDIYLFLDGIPGESDDADHLAWIVVDSYSHSLANDIFIGPSGGTGSGAPFHAPVNFSKSLDKSSPPIIEKVNVGGVIPSARFEFIRSGTQPFRFLKVDLETVFATGYNIGASGGEVVPTEQISLLYEKIKFTYYVQNQDGSLGDSVVTTWDVVANQPLAAEASSFKVMVDGSDLVFSWQTLSESGNYGFEIQHRERDGFKRAAYIPAAGWSSQPLEYEVRVRGLEDGIHVFRLASLGLGGDIAYTPEIRVALGVPDGERLALDSVYPNPFVERANIAVSVAQQEQGRISLFDVLGREVAVVFDGLLEPGAKQHFVFEPTAALPAGPYLLRVETERDVQSQMLVRVR